MATEFVCTINKSGQDYATVTLWEAAIQCDLTSAATKVNSGSLTRGAIADGVAITQSVSGATGVCLHHTATQMLINSIVGTPNATGTWYPTADGNDATNAWTPTDAGDSAIAVASLYDDLGDFTAGFTISGSTTNATNYFKVTVPAGDRHNGTAFGGGVFFNLTSYGFLYIPDIAGIIEWVRMKAVASYNYTWSDLITVSSSGKIKNCIVHDSQNTGPGTDPPGINVFGVGESALNCIVYNCAGTGIRGGDQYGGWSFTIRNCTVYNCGGVGILNVGNGTAEAINNLSVGNAGGDYSAANWDTFTNNGSGDTSGSVGLQNLTTAEFVNVTGGSENLHLASGVTSIDAGTDLGTTNGVNFDIDNRDRDALGDTWDIGADEFVSTTTRRRWDF